MFFNGLLVNGLITATEPLIAVLMLGSLGFAPWQYGLAFPAPCVGGLIGSRLARRLVARFGRDSGSTRPRRTRWPAPCPRSAAARRSRCSRRCGGCWPASQARAGIAIAGVLILATPVLLPRPRRSAGKAALTPEPLA